jgi:hypothetical protein
MTNTLVQAPPPVKHAVKVPHTLELTALFREFMSHWAGAKTEFLDWGTVQPAAQSMECIVRLNGTVKGALVIRSTERLLGRLMVLFQEKGKGGQDKAGVFQEMTALYSMYLINSVWMDEFFNLGPIFARPCGPQDRPP